MKTYLIFSYSINKFEFMIGVRKFSDLNLMKLSMRNVLKNLCLLGCIFDIKKFIICSKNLKII